MRRIGQEASKADRLRRQNGFYEEFLDGRKILDIGFRGDDPLIEPIVAHATGVDLDYPGYDGLHLPFEDETQDAVFASHILEHIVDYRTALKEWFRVLKVGGYLLLFVPHKYLYERRPVLPSPWSGAGHKRFYTPAALLAEVESSLPRNGYRVRHLADNDLNYDYRQSVRQPPRGCYEIEFVIEKIARPAYSEKLELSEAQVAVHQKLLHTFRDRVLALVDNPESESSASKPLTWIPAFTDLREAVLAVRGVPEEVLCGALQPLLKRVQVDEAWYLDAYPDARASVVVGVVPSAREHFLKTGYFEGRMPDDAYGVWLDSDD